MRLSYQNSLHSDITLRWSPEPGPEPYRTPASSVGTGHRELGRRPLASAPPEAARSRSANAATTVPAIIIATTVWRDSILQV